MKMNHLEKALNEAKEEAKQGYENAGYSASEYEQHWWGSRLKMIEQIEKRVEELSK